MPNIFDQFDAASEVKDLATSFGVGSNQLLKTVGDVYGLATGDMDNVVSRQGRENIDYLQRGKSEKLRQAEARRKAAVDAEEGTLNQALKYAKETFTDPRLLLSGTAEAVPSLVGAGGIGAGARVAAGRVLGKKGAETAAKIGVGSAVAAGSGQQGTSVGAEQYSEVADILKKMPDEQAMEVPEIARLMSENGYSLEKAKNALTLNLARSTGALAAIGSAATQMVPGGRTIESALVGGAGRKVAGGTLARRGIGAAIGGLGESLQEGAEEGSGAGLKNLLARAVEPEREITKGVGEAMGAGFSGAALLGAAAGAASRPSRPVPVGETTAGKSGEPQASDATSDIPVLESTTEQPSISLRDIENMSPEEFAAAIDVRDAASRGGKPRPEDVTSLENVRPGPVQESDTTIAPVQEALDEWRNQNPDVGLSVTVVNDPNLRNTRNYGIRGYFDPNTGEVVINSAFTKPFEVESVVNHEWSHHTLASDEGRAALAEFATRDIPATELSDLAKRYPNADNLTLVEEWIARNQEKSPGVFARIVAKIREWLNGKLGINMTNEEAARVMLRTLRERGAPIAEEGSAEMRQSTTDQPVGESEPVKREPGRSGMMASPSVVDINYDRAKRNLTSSDQARFRSDVEGFAPEATVYNAVGDWADGAENSVAAVFKDVRSSEELRQLAASAGLTGDQKAALWWRVEENGPDAIHQVTWPKGITMDEARQAMIDAGLENRTLIQTRDGVMGFVFDQGQQNLSKIDKLYESSTNPSTHSSPATGEFVGSWGTRIEGKRAYRNVLGLPTKTPEGEGVSGLGVRGRGEPETGAEAGPATGGGGVLSSPGRMDAGTGSKTSSRQPNETVRKLADEYNVQSGQDPIEHGHYVPVNESLAQRIAKAYDALPEIDRSPETIRAYETLAKEVGDQWDFAVNNLGITFEPWTKEGQPYANSREMVKDVRDNNHLYFFQGGDPHPFLNEVDPQTGFTANDKLRAVHDLFGHAAEDYQFGPRGEENAWIKHSQMFSPEAQRALSSETRGQNSWVNFGAQNYENGVNKNIPAKDRPFAVQKTALLPEELTDWRAALGKSESEFESESEPERASVLAKQPIRESVTDEPVGQTKKQTESPEFKKWFGDWQDPKAFTSRAKGPVSQVFKDGKPLVVYHATTKDFDAFESGRPTFDDMGFFGNVETNRHAIFFSDVPEQAASYVTDPKGRADTGARTIPAYLDMKSPLYLDRNTRLDDLAEETGVNYNWLQNRRTWWELLDGEDGKGFVEGLKKAGYDGIVFEEDPIRPGVEVGNTYAVFEPSQVKSATGNRGTFDPTNPDIRFSVTDEPVEVTDLPRNLKGDSEGFIPIYITKQNALPTVVTGKNKTVEVPVIDFSQYADRSFKARGQSEFTGKDITLAEAHVPVIQRYYAGLSPETYQAKDVRAAADMVANDMSNNLLFLHDLALDTFGPEVVKRMSKWYDGANVIAKMFADKYGVSVEQSAAILATLSPQKHWFVNVSLAENVMDVMRNHQDTVFDAAVEKAARASIKNSDGTTSSKRELYTAIRAISGKKLSDLSDLKEQTIFTRFLSQGIHPKLAYIVTPEGQLTPGSSVAVAWSGAPITSNAVSAFLDGSVDNLTVALGGGHKVRNFNGNIIDPMSPFFYTSDTHNVAASLLIPVGGTDFEVSHNFGGNPGVGEGPKLPVIGTTVTGLQGTYPIYLEAGRRAAEQRNVLPRQMQSITWEMIRIMFTDDMKTPAFMDSVKRVHDQVRGGGLDIDSARQNIIELSGGRDAIKARPPEWLNK